MIHGWSIFCSIIFLFASSGSASGIISCSELYPTSFPSLYYTSPSPNKVIHWPLGYISSGNYSLCPRFSIMRFAVEYITNYTSLIPNIALDFVASDMNNSRTNGLLASVTQIQSYFIRSVMGAASDVEADATAFLANEFQLPQVSTVQSVIYSNSDLYPYYMRTIPPYNYQRGVLQAIMCYFNWTRAILVTTDDAYGKDALGYIASTSLTTIHPIVISTDDSDFSSQVENISSMTTEYKVILMFTSFPTGVLFLQQMRDAGLINGSVQYILSAVMTQPLVENYSNIIMCDGLLDGAIGMLPYGGDGPMYPNISALWKASDPNRFPGPRPANSWLWYSFETVYLQAFTLHNLLSNNIDITSLTGGQYYDALVNTSYEGVTGTVKFNVFGDRIGNWRVLNFVDGSNGTRYSLRAKYLIESQHLTNITPFTFFGGSSYPVIELPEIPLETQARVTYYRTFGFSVAIASCTAFAIISAVVLMRKWKAFQRHGPYYCLIINTGTLFSFASAGLLLFQPTPINCMIFPWLIGIGFDLVYGCLFIKTWTLYLVFRRASKFQMVKLSTWYIVKILGIFMSTDILLLLVWTFVFPPSTYVVTLLDTSSELRCQYKDGLMWIFFLVPKGAWLLFGAVLSFLTRSLSKEYSESKSIGYVIYHDICLLCLAFPLGYALQDVPGGITIVEIVGIMECFTFTIFVLFFPVWYDIFYAKYATIVKISPAISGRRRRSLLPNSPMSASSPTPLPLSLPTPPPTPPDTPTCLPCIPPPFPHPTSASFHPTLPTIQEEEQSSSST